MPSSDSAMQLRFCLERRSPRFLVSLLDLNQCLMFLLMFQLSADQIYIPIFRHEQEGDFVIRLFFAPLKSFSVVSCVFFDLVYAYKPAWIGVLDTYFDSRFTPHSD